ncbi:hypothetical protein FB561_1940 [Kribbella amoyensis]|uniref:Uncharacterized protein n=1 Tax=Kribbella amoyensis TaxID=996641 RepID=A0A561BPQ5_9ACTN|nr:hypothetical protein [Kribbella amoyensis]TWD80844.1 hypothetical protein FB561_1940 [Kribbella amoyensis]
MTDSLVRPPGNDPRPILQAPLPAHVLAVVGRHRRPAWLIGRLHTAEGLLALVQYTDDDGHECTVRVPIDQISL